MFLCQPKRSDLKIAVKIYLPDIIGGGYAKFWNSKKRYRVLKGGKGSKKSTTTAINIIYRMMKYKEANTLVVRQVMDTHRTSTYAQLKWAIQRLQVAHLWRCTVSPMEITYIPTGQKILFRGFDDVLKIASTTVDKGFLCWVWIEEAYEIENEDDFIKLDLSVPRGTVPPPLFKQTTLTFNPWHEGHWLKKRFFDNPDNNVDTFSTNYLCNEFLDDVDRSIFEEMKKNNPRRYRVAGLGEWGISEGLIFENWEVKDFDKSKIGITGEQGQPDFKDETWKYRHIFGLDYGYTNDPAAFICAAVNPIDKVIYIYDEHYQTRMLNSDIANMIKRKGYAKERIYADCAEPKSNDDLRRLGISRVTPSVKGKDSVLNGIAKIQEYKIIVHPTCKNTVMELSSYCWGKDKAGNSLNKPVDRNNHLMDALRYAFEDIRHFKPRDPKIKIRRPQPLIYSTDINGGWS